MEEKRSGAVLMAGIGGTMRRSREEGVVPIMDMVTMTEEVASAAEAEALAEETSVVAVAITRTAVEATVDTGGSEVVAEEWEVALEEAGEGSGGRA